MSIEIVDLNKISHDMVLLTHNTEYKNLIRDGDGSALGISYGSKLYVLGLPSSFNTFTPNSEIQFKLYDEHYGTINNDIYNQISDVADFGVLTSNTQRTLSNSNSIYIGSLFHSGSTTQFGFNFDDTDIYNWFVDTAYTGAIVLAPLAPNESNESILLMNQSGAKFYQTASGTVSEANAYRINIGTPQDSSIITRTSLSPASCCRVCNTTSQRLRPAGSGTRPARRTLLCSGVLAHV